MMLTLNYKSLSLLCTIVYLTKETNGFGLLSRFQSHSSFITPISSVTIVRSIATFRQNPTLLFSTPAEESDEDSLSPEDKEKIVGNLVADDEWAGLTMELTETIRLAIVEDLKKNGRDFLGKDDYNVGDISKEIDNRIKSEVANMRGKDDYELGDLIVVLDGVSKDLTCQLTGKDDYEFGDLSNEIDVRVKKSVAAFCGKDEYKVGDLSQEMDKRVKEGISKFTGKGDYEFGDVAKELVNRRKKWVEEYLGKEAAEKYEFGDITKKALAGFTGKDDYQFGDVTKKIMGNMFGKK